MSRSVAAAPNGPDGLDALPRDGLGFRLRGLQASRLETFVDAAFAFAVTLLVVSFDAMPASVPELHDALRRAPAFLAGFAILAMFWVTHHRFSRRTGLLDARVTLLGLALIAVALLYVYPLRLITGIALHFVTAGWAPLPMSVDAGAGGFRSLYVIYGLGFGAMCSILWLLNRHALARADALALDALGEMVNVLMGYLVRDVMADDDVSYRALPPDMSVPATTLAADRARSLAIGMGSQLGAFVLLVDRPA